MSEYRLRPLTEEEKIIALDPDAWVVVVAQNDSEEVDSNDCE